MSKGNTISKPEHLTLNGRVFSFEDIRTKALEELQPQSDFEESTLTFVKQWLSGADTFSIHTSGSTGQPKEIRISRVQMLKSAEMTAHAFALSAGDRILVNLHTRYIAGMMMLVRGLHLELHIVAVEPSSNPLRNEHSPFDFFAFVPMQLQTIIESGEVATLNNAKAIIVGGAPVTVMQEQLFRTLSCPVYATYGMTETCTHVALRRIGETQYHAIEGVRFEADEKECLVIYSPTAIEQPLYTHDVVELHSTDSFIWRGRLDNVINSGGIKIHIEELEQKIYRILFGQGNSQRIVVAALPDDTLGQKVALISEGDLDPEDLHAQLAVYEKPRVHFRINPFPLTPTGKTDRKKLLELIAQ